ncbi:MAG: hypothetical protein ACD_41C00345G0008 [uncultured bacterium]|nr:MAG: hypothetical protein ACD_41C00345G0008 [uncultured bacterium]HBY73862.1 hypothetical protein [Candidatus Kerfeldbacteria bacterium]
MTLSGSDFNFIIKYPFSGKDWFVRICLQGAVLMLLCPFLIGIPFFTGFVMTITRRGIDGSADYPGWNEWGLFWKRGWKALVINFVYYIPILVIFFTYFAVVLIPILIGTATEVDEIAAIGAIFGAFGMVLLYACLFFYMIFFAVVQMATAPLIALDVPLSASFQFKQYIWPYIKANALNLVLAWLISYIAGLVAAMGMVFLFFGLFLTLPIAVAITAYAHGVIYRISPVKYKGQS